MDDTSEFIHIQKYIFTISTNNHLLQFDSNVHSRFIRFYTLSLTLTTRSLYTTGMGRGVAGRPPLGGAPAPPPCRGGVGALPPWWDGLHIPPPSFKLTKTSRPMQSNRQTHCHILSNAVSASDHSESRGAEKPPSDPAAGVAVQSPAILEQSYVVSPARGERPGWGVATPPRVGLVAGLAGPAVGSAEGLPLSQTHRFLHDHDCHQLWHLHVHTARSAVTSFTHVHLHIDGMLIFPT